MKFITPIFIAPVFVAVCASATFFTACNNSVEDLRFTTICRDSTAGKAHQQLCYPQFEGAHSDAFMKAVVALVEGDSIANLRSRPTFGDLFVQYATDVKEMVGEEYATEMSYEQMDSVSVSYNENEILCLTNQTYNYMGGAHGGSAITYKILDAKTGKTLNIKDFFKPNTEAELLKIGEACFRKQWLPEMELATDAPMTEENGLWFGGMAMDETDKDKGKFYLAKDAGISSKGFEFVYQQYEIGPYAIGMPSFTISFEQVKALLKDEYKF
jgi:Deacetylase PdaC/Protein of unknown function (DUF3298)